MSNTQLLINQLQDVSTRGSCQLLTSVETSCSRLINSCVLLISEFRYYQHNYEPLQYQICTVCLNMFYQTALRFSLHLVGSVKDYAYFYIGVIQ